MKTNKVIIALAFFLSGFLFFSNMLDHKMNGAKIGEHQCRFVKFTPFPENFDYSAHARAGIQATNTSKNYFKNNHLNLSLLSLESLPDDLFKKGCSTCITNLSFESNFVKEIPLTIRHLTQLKTLSLNANELSSISKMNQYARNFKQLEELDLAKNDIRILDFLPISKKLNVVNLDYNNIQAINLPEDASNYYAKEISLIGNYLRKFPIQLLRINGLDTLDLSKNYIYAIPKLVQSKTDFKVTTINLNNNALSQFPHGLAQVKNLETLHIKNNRIIGKLQFKGTGFMDLQSVELNSQYVDSVIIKSNALPKVDTLMLNKNKITYFEASANSLQSIELINLVGNQLTSFPADILHLKNLKNCALSKNIIEGHIEISNSNLETLDLSSNNITSIHFSGKNKIKELNLEYNNLTSFTYDEGAIPYLETLNLDNNPDLKEIASELIKNVPNLAAKSIIGTFIFRDFKNELLDISNNELETIHFAGTNNITKLILEYSNFKTITFSNGALKKLELFDISNNSKLTTFPFGIFTEAPNLKTIDIIGCSSLSEEDRLKVIELATKFGVNYLTTGDMNYVN